MRLVSCAAAVVGGILLLVRLAFDVPESVQWAGLALLGVAVLCGGLMLVPAAPLWLQAIVGLGTVALAAGVLVTLHGELSVIHVDAAVGVLAIVVFGGMALREPRRRPQEPQAPSHRR